MDDMNKSWGTLEDDTKEVMGYMNVTTQPIKKVEPIITKHDYAAPIKWKQTIDVNELKNTPLIKHTKTHTPIPHEKILSSFQGAITRLQMYRIAEKGLLSSDGSRYFYLSDVVLRNDKNKPIKYGYVNTVGFVNFNHKHLWGCSPVHGETMFNVNNEPLEFFTRQGFTKTAKLKHTKNGHSYIQPKCRNMVKEFSMMKKRKRKNINTMKKMEFTDRYFGYIVLNLIRKLACNREVLSVKSVENLITLWESNVYPNTLWGFHHAFTETFQKWKNPIRRLMIYDYYYQLLLNIIDKKSRIV